MFDVLIGEVVFFVMGVVGFCMCCIGVVSMVFVVFLISVFIGVVVGGWVLIVGFDIGVMFLCKCYCGLMLSLCKIWLCCGFMFVIFLLLEWYFYVDCWCLYSNFCVI